MLALQTLRDSYSKAVEWRSWRSNHKHHTHILHATNNSHLQVFLAHNFWRMFVGHDAVCLVVSWKCFVFIPFRRQCALETTNAHRMQKKNDVFRSIITRMYFAFLPSFDLPFIVMAIFHSFLSRLLCCAYVFAHSFRQSRWIAGAKWF